MGFIINKCIKALFLDSRLEASNFLSDEEEFYLQFQ